jgi:apolipoprotein N-acyltransferase
MTLDIPPMTGLTPYARFGNVPLVLVLFVIVAAFAAPLWRRRNA